MPEGGFVLAANHNSNFDPWPLGVTLFPRRYLRFMAKSELFWTPFKQFATSAGAFPVRRGQADLEAIETAARLCREGHIVVMFPEGTRRKKGLRKKHEARAHASLPEARPELSWARTGTASPIQATSARMQPLR